MEILIGVLGALILYLSLGSFQLLSTYINRLEANRVNLLPNTYSMINRSISIIQNPNIPTHLTVTPSSNESTGIEFTYSFFLNIPQQAFTTGTPGLRHIFHKGSPNQYPLLGPGVYMKNDTNTLRVYMNSYDTWNNTVDVVNFPIGKWCHVVILCRSMHLEVYVNGNIVNRLGLNISAPYQNYGDVYAFVNSAKTIPPRTNTAIQVLGGCMGQLSRLAYFNYALSYSEINKMMNQGPSTTMDTDSDGNATAYLTDNWWTADFTQ